MSWTTLRPQISNLIDSLTEIHEVSNSPKLDFSGYPGVYVIPSDVTSDYETTIENTRVYAFIVRVFYETKETTVAIALDNISSAVDAIVDAIDQEDKKNAGRTIGVSMPADYTYLAVMATPSLWGQLPNENLIMGEIRVRVLVSFDAT